MDKFIEFLQNCQSQKVRIRTGPNRIYLWFSPENSKFLGKALNFVAEYGPKENFDYSVFLDEVVSKRATGVREEHKEAERQIQALNKVISESYEAGLLLTSVVHRGNNFKPPLLFIPRQFYEWEYQKRPRSNPFIRLKFESNPILFQGLMSFLCGTD